uniref:Viral A-type inclusion protein n=1 Tax=Panagrolaimus sp. JU765 TaxID=591449 RepID=A0AC34QZU0_9BILA
MILVVNSHRRKLDEALLKQQTEMNKAVHDLRTKLDETQEQKQQLQTKYDSCLNSKNENEKTNDLNKISIDNANDEKLKNENEQLKNQIMALTNELEKFKKEMVSMKHSRNEIQPEKNDTVQVLL